MSIPKEIHTRLANSRSAIRAAAILEALRKDDAEQLNSQLSSAVPPEVEPDESFFEVERQELVDAIASRIGCYIASGQDASLYIHLLRHLATPAYTPLTRSCEN